MISLDEVQNWVVPVNMTNSLFSLSIGFLLSNFWENFLKILRIVMTMIVVVVMMMLFIFCVDDDVDDKTSFILLIV